MIPELNTVISVSSVLMLALTNNNSKAELRASKHSQTRSPGPLGNSEHIKYFNPDPSIVTSGLCSYKYITNRVPNRIPGMIKRLCRMQMQYAVMLNHCKKEYAMLL